MNLPPHRLWFIIGCAFEAGLFVIAALAGWLLGQPLLDTLQFDAEAAMLGCLASLLPLSLFIWMLQSPPRPLAHIHQILESTVRPLFEKLSVIQLCILSVLAGIGEEVLFRSIIQGALAQWTGPWIGLLVAGVIFGAMHPVSWAYVVLAAIMGIYLGWLWLLSGNLLTPIVAHAFYDFIALVYLVKWFKPSG